MAESSPLRRRMIEDMTVRNLSPATQRSYIYAVAKFSRCFGCSPDRLGLDDVRTFQVHLASQGISWARFNQTVAALRFFYGVTLGQQEIPERIAYAREPRRLPLVLGADEVVRGAGAPEAIQTVDRWHLLENCCRALLEAVRRRPADLRAAAETIEPIAPLQQAPPMTSAERRHWERWQRSWQACQEALRLHGEGASINRLVPVR